MLCKKMYFFTQHWDSNGSATLESPNSALDAELEFR
jgi:hypothetical protein